MFLLLFCGVYLTSAFSPGLLDDADATHAEAAREMAVSGDFVTLHVNGIRYLEKAPLPYWLVAISYRIFGVNEFATRLPNVLALLGLALLSARWANRAFGSKASLYAALLVATAAGVYLFTRILIPEALLSLFMTASLYFFSSALEEGSTARWRWYAGYIALALAVLTKGLVALVFVGATALLYLLISDEWRRWREFHLFSGLLVLLVVAGPWHLLAGLRNPGFFWFYFVNEHFLRFLGRRYPKDYNKLPALAYWTMHLAWLFPWSLYLPLAVRDAWRQWHTRPRSSSPAARARLLLWTYATVILLFFSFSTNQEYYTFPAYVPLLLLLADAVSREEETSSTSRWLLVPGIIVCLIGVVSGCALLAGVWASRHLPYAPDIGSLLTQRNVGGYTLSMSHFFDLTTASFAALRLPAILAAVALLVAPALALYFRLRGRAAAATWSLVGCMAVFLFAAHLALRRFEPFLSSKPLAQAIAAQIQPQDRLMIYGDQAFGSSLLFYLQRPIELVNGRTTSMWFGSRFPDAPHIFLEEADLVSAWKEPGRIFLFVTAEQRARVDAWLPQPVYVVAESSGKAVYSNRR